MIGRDTHFSIYNAGFDAGRDMVQDWIGESPDLFDMAIEALPKGTRKSITNSPEDDIIKGVKNYHDGLEDGVRAQLQRELKAYVTWLRSQS